MTKQKVSTKEFDKIVKDRVREICGERGWSYDKEQHRGLAFQFFVAEVILSFEPFETDLDDAVLRAKDLGADLVLEDESRQHFLISQCKFTNKSPTEDEINSFFSKHKDFADKKWVRKHGSNDASRALADYGEKMKSGYKAVYYFITTAEASDRPRELAEPCTATYREQGVQIRCELLDSKELKAYYVRSLSMEASIPDEVRFPLPKRYFKKDQPLPTMIMVLSSNVLRNIYREHKEGIFAYNIRGYLGSRGINDSIRGTAETQPELFFYFNNGVSAICTGFRIEGSDLIAEKMQIINGAQTVGVLSTLDATHPVEVLFRLTQTLNVVTEKGTNRDIIRYNNTQNVVKVSDFRSNDAIQIWLEKKFKELRPRGPLPPIAYVRKRLARRKKDGYSLGLELMAKIRYAWLVEPTSIHAAPKQLWTPAETPDDKTALYDKAFGVDGQLGEFWSDGVFNDALLAVAFYIAIETATTEKAQRSPTFDFLKRLRFHGVSLAARYCQSMILPEDRSALLESKARFEEHWRPFWEMAQDMLVDEHARIVEEEGVSLFAYIRSDLRWKALVSRYEKRLLAKKT